VDKVKNTATKAAVMSSTLVLSTAIFSPTASAQLPVDFSQTIVTTTELRDDIYMLQGEGGNIVVAVARDGLVVVDSQFAPLYDRIKTAIGEISSLPVRYLVNTHHHGDHTGGNAHFAEDGAIIVSHENMRDLLALGSPNALRGTQNPPAAPAAVPTLTYANRMTIELEGLRAELGHPGDAHTNGDTFITFPEANILVTGDIVTFGRYPNIDFALGGHIDRMISATDAFIAMVDDNTIVVPGHGAIGDKQSLIDYRQILSTSRDRVQAMMEQGHALDEIIAAQPNADYDQAMNVEQRRIDNWIRVIYYSYRPNQDP
jgi:glyoxylase-like metal-dependent hydrolase (beta-lactamase superfamily II)